MDAWPVYKHANLKKAKLNYSLGFFYITDFGLTQEEVDRQFAIAKEIFALPLEEKLKYRAELEDGHYHGYRPLGMIEQFPGLRDNFEMYNIFKFLPQFQRSHPDVANEHIAEIEKFQRHIV
jgi:isopenicillin N synthase-like dioxygenase